MARVTLKFEDGTTANLEGTPEEVAKLTKLLRGGHAPAAPTKRKSAGAKSSKKKSEAPNDDKTDIIVEIVNSAKNCDEADSIETQVLDRSSQVDRVLLPLYILHEHYSTYKGLTSGDISKITRELGIPIHMANAANTLAGSASKYVMADGVRKKGQAVRYRLSRRGLQYFNSVLAGAGK